MTFHPDGRTLFCGYDNNLKVYSWEPVLCHDAVDMGWSTLGDLCIREGNLIGCSYYRNSIGVWVADLSCVKPYGTRDSCSPQDGSAVKLKFDIQGNQSVEKVGQAAEPPSVLRSTLPDTDAADIKNIYVDYEKPVRSRRTGLTNRSKTVSPPPPHTQETSKASAGKQSTPIATSTKPNGSAGGRSFFVPSFVPRESSSGKSSANLRRESLTPTTARVGTGGSVKATNTSSKSNSRFDVRAADQIHQKPFDKSFADVGVKDLVEDTCPTLEKKVEDVQEKPSPVLSSNLQSRNNPLDRKEIPTVKVVNGAAAAHGRTRSLVEKFEKVGLCSSSEDPMVSVTPEVVADRLKNSTTEEEPQVSGRKMTSANDTNVIEDLMQNHDVLLSGLRSRLTKLQMIRHLWERNDVKGAITALRKLPDQSVHADVIGVLMEKMEIITLDLFSCMLPILVGLLDSKMERHAKLSMEMLLKLVALFGPTISSTISTPPSVGVDLHQEERIERSKQCFSQLHQIRGFLPALARRGGSLAKSALELNLVLQDHSM